MAVLRLAVNPNKTLRFAFVEQFLWHEQLGTPKYCAQGKRNLEKV